MAALANKPPVKCTDSSPRGVRLTLLPNRSNQDLLALFTIPRALMRRTTRGGIGGAYKSNVSGFRPTSGRGSEGGLFQCSTLTRYVQLSVQPVVNVCTREEEEEASINTANISDGRVMAEVQLMSFIRPVNKSRLKSITVMISHL